MNAVVIAALSVQTGALVAAVFIGCGLSLAVVAAIIRVRSKQRSLAEILDNTMGTAPVPVELVSESPERGELAALTVRIAGVFGRIDTGGVLEKRLDRASTETGESARGHEFPERQGYYENEAMEMAGGDAWPGGGGQHLWCLWCHSESRRSRPQIANR